MSPFRRERRRGNWLSSDELESKVKKVEGEHVNDHEQIPSVEELVARTSKTR